MAVLRRRWRRWVRPAQPEARRGDQGLRRQQLRTGGRRFQPPAGEHHEVRELRALARLQPPEPELLGQGPGVPGLDPHEPEVPGREPGLPVAALPAAGRVRASTTPAPRRNRPEASARASARWRGRPRQPTIITSASVVSASIAMNSGTRWYQWCAVRRGPETAEPGDEVEVEVLGVRLQARSRGVVQVEQRAQQPADEQHDDHDRQPHPDRDPEHPARRSSPARAAGRSACRPPYRIVRMSLILATSRRDALERSRPHRAAGRRHAARRGPRAGDRAARRAAVCAQRGRDRGTACAAPAGRPAGRASTGCSSCSPSTACSSASTSGDGQARYEPARPAASTITTISSARAAARSSPSTIPGSSGRSPASPAGSASR